MKLARILFLIGTIHWFAFASLHSFIVDVDFVLGKHSPLGPEVIPDGDLVRESLIANTWDFGKLGVQNAHRALSGFSIWLGVSAFFFGLFNAVIGLSRKLPPELFYRMAVINAVTYAALTVFAFVFWINPPQVNGVTGTILFGLAALVMRRERTTSS
tara:strand:- start:190 stop:660 length:471 start_codon:yes stop_codon:yes gene_type:complete